MWRGSGGCRSTVLKPGVVASDTSGSSGKSRHRAGFGRTGPGCRENGLLVYFLVSRRRLRNVGPLQAQSEPENGGGGSGPPLWRALPHSHRARQGKATRRQRMPFPPRPSIPAANAPEPLLPCKTVPNTLPYLYRDSPAPWLRSRWASFKGAVPAPQRRPVFPRNGHPAPPPGETTTLSS